MRHYEFTEARRNPEQNPTVTTDERVLKRQEQAEVLPIGNGVTNCFVSFTEIDKLGINPSSRGKTPNGIYAYSADFLENWYRDGNTTFDLPYAGDSKYANIFEISNDDGIIVIDKLSKSDYLSYVDDLVVVANLVRRLNPKVKIEEIYEIIDAATESVGKARTKSPGGHLWYVTWKVTNDLIEDFSLPITPTLLWRNILVAIGINGIIDTGHGIIHDNEPAQAVFFTSKIITNNERIVNKNNRPSAAEINAQTQLDKKAYADVRKSSVDSVGYSDIKYLTRKQRLELLANNPQSIAFVKYIKPEEIELIKQNPVMLKYVTTATGLTPRDLTSIAYHSEDAAHAVLKYGIRALIKDPMDTALKRAVALPYEIQYAIANKYPALLRALMQYNTSIYNAVDPRIKQMVAKQ